MRSTGGRQEEKKENLRQGCYKLSIALNVTKGPSFEAICVLTTNFLYVELNDKAAHQVVGVLCA